MQRRPSSAGRASPRPSGGSATWTIDTGDPTGEGRRARRIELSRIETGLLSASPFGGGTVTTTRAELLRRVWDESGVGDDHRVDVHISNLRHKLEDDPANPRDITTVRGRGFSMRRH